MATVSNATDKSTATQTVRPGGFLWWNPIAMSLVNCSRAEVVERSGAGRIYWLIIGIKRGSMIFVAGQRSEMGRYEVPREVSLPGFSIGMINDHFHIAGIRHIVTER